MTILPARLAAFDILLRVERDNAYSTFLLATLDDEADDRDRALCHELTLGVLRWQLFLDQLISHYANRDPLRLDAAVRITLRLGLYQLRFLSRIPPSAAVNESVKLVRNVGVGSASSLVNAVLRRATRESDYDPAAGISDPLKRVAIATSHPVWLIARWASLLGFEEAEALAITNNQIAPVSFRVVAGADEDQVLRQLTEAGATLEPSRIVGNAWRITGTRTLLRELASRGQVYIQDEASQLVSHVVGVRPGDTVLDLCAAPGGKTTHLAAMAEHQSVIIACDAHEHRLQAVYKSARLQQLANVHCVVVDGLVALPFPEGHFDRVLVDAPCSGTGTLRRNPEIRWRISAEDIENLSERQGQLLVNAARVVKPGGRLVYSTCSVESEENEDVASAFLGRNEIFTQVSVPVVPEMVTSSGAVRNWPHRQGADGFFVVAFERSR